MRGSINHTKSVPFVMVSQVRTTTTASPFSVGGFSGGWEPLPETFHHGAQWVSSVFLPDLRGDRRCVRDRHLQGGDRQHFRSL